MFVTIIVCNIFAGCSPLAKNKTTASAAPTESMADFINNCLEPTMLSWLKYILMTNGFNYIKSLLVLLPFTNPTNSTVFIRLPGQWKKLRCYSIFAPQRLEYCFITLSWSMGKRMWVFISQCRTRCPSCPQLYVRPRKFESAANKPWTYLNSRP